MYYNLERYPNNIYPVRNIDGSWTGTSLYPDNPVGVSNDYGIYFERDRYLQANLNLKEKLDRIIPGLFLNQAVSFNTWMRSSNSKWKRFARYIDGVQQTADKNTNFSVWDDAGTNQYLWSQITIGSGYNRNWGLNNFSAGINYLVSSLKVDANQNGWAGNALNYNYLNLSGTLHYDFNNRYLLDFAYSTSGSDNYAKGHRWGFYPAVAAAWVMSKEPFLKDNNTINYLKISASAGKTGNDQFWGDRYLYQQYFTTTGWFNTGNTSLNGHQGIIQGNVTNTDFFAETSTKYNIGVEATFVKNLDVKFEIFRDKRSGIVTQDYSLMDVFGGALPYRNIGKVTNQGLEASLQYSKKLGDLQISAGGMLTWYKNTIDYMAEIQPVEGAKQTGKSIGLKYGYQCVGFYQLEDFKADGTLKEEISIPAFGAIQPGDLKYSDLNKDGKVNEIDITQVGSPYLPSLNYSFVAGMEWKGFDIQLLFQGANGRDINLLDASNQTLAFNNNGTVYELAQNAWAYYPEQNIDTRATANYPRLSTMENLNNYRLSSFWVKNGSFLKLRNLEMGYSLPETFAKKIHISGLRIFVSVSNLFTWSKLLKDYNLDPETMSGVPAVKTSIVGLNIIF